MTLKTYGDWFTGFGGMTLGAIDAGLNVIFGAEYDSKIAEVYRLNIGDHIRVCNLLEVDVSEFPRVDVFHASPPCFPAGTSVLTKRGLVDISEVVVGDLVLTHLCRWRPVVRTLKRESEVVELQGLGHWGLVATDDHPFLASRLRLKYYPHKERGDGHWYETLLTEPEWTKAKDMKGKQWLSHATYPYDDIPTMEFRGNESIRGQVFNLNDPSFWWIVGAWVGDGWVRYEDGEDHAKNRGTVFICSSHEQSGLLEERMQNARIKYSRNQERTTTRFSIHSRPFCRWLTDFFGKYAHGKTIPYWLLGQDEVIRNSFLDGYIFADGYRNHPATYNKPVVNTSTVSPNLAVGLRMLGISLGYSVTVKRYERKREKATIENRTVNERPSYSIRMSTSERHSRYVDSSGIKYRTGLVRNVISHSDVRLVYDITVDEDESFIADGIIVHNCPNFSNAKANGKETDNDIALSAKVAEYIAYHLPDVFTLENVYKYRQSKSWQVIAKTLHDNGYLFNYWHVNMADYGVPQTRKRMIVIARRDRVMPTLPPATHAKEQIAGMFGGLEKWVGWYEAIEDIFDTRVSCQLPPWAAFIKPVPKAGTFALMPNSTGYARAWKGRGVLSPSRPAATFSANSLDKIFYCTEEGDYKPTINHALRFQSFPIQYILPNSQEVSCRGIGNAVPPLFASKLYTHLLQQYSG